jgi:glycosyltransferase involved in cell wall biosynthesis
MYLKWVFFLAFSFVFAGERKICLNMIVKDESPIIATCLASVKHVVDYWVIVDTGSTDGTQKIILDFMKDVPGELHERPWVNFEHNRNEAFRLAKDKAEYCLFIDADQVLVFAEGKKMPPLDQDDYLLEIRHMNGDCCPYRSLVKNQLDWKWVGVLHESIESSKAKTHGTLDGIYVLSDTSKGHRSQDPQKYIKDAHILEDALAKDPANSRYRFYLGLSYANGGEYELALQNFEKRASLDVQGEETYCTKFLIARMQELLGKPPEIFTASYKKAHDYYPSRIESLYYLADYYIRQKNYAESYKILKSILPIAPCRNLLFVERWIYDWGVLYHYILSCFHLKKYGEMKEAMEKVLLSESLPLNLREETVKNLSKFKKKSLLLLYVTNFLDKVHF